LRNGQNDIRAGRCRGIHRWEDLGLWFDETVPQALPAGTLVWGAET